MALQDGVRIGGVYAEVALDFTRLDRDLKDLRTRLDRAGRDARLGVGGATSGGAGGAVGGSASTTLAVLGVGRMLGAGMAKAVQLLSSIAKSAAVMEIESRANQKALHDLVREEQRQEHAARQEVHYAAARGERMRIDRGQGYEALPVEARMLAGVGFNRQIRAVPAPGQPAGPAGFHRMLGDVHGLMLGFNRMGGAVSEVEIRFDRLRNSLGMVGRIGGGAFRAVAAAASIMLSPVRLAVGMLGRLGGRRGEPGMPGPEGMAGVTGGIPSAPGMGGLVRGGLMLGGAALAGSYVLGAAKSAATGDATTGSLARDVAAGFQESSKTLGQAMLPAIREFLALMIDIREATRGVTDMFGEMARAIGAAVANTILLGRKIIANWGETKKLITLVFAQMQENAGYLVNWLIKAFGVFLDWFRDNFKSIMTDAVKAPFTYLENARKASSALGTAVGGLFRGEGWNFNAPAMTPYNFTTPAPQLPAYNPPQTRAEDIFSSWKRLWETVVPTPEKMAKEAETRRAGKAGDLVGAQELYSMISRTATGAKEDSKNHRKTAQNTTDILNKLTEMAGKVGSVMF